jgi:hypothetical protein
MGEVNSGFSSPSDKVGDLQIARLMASADYLGNGAIETNRYETEIADIVRRESLFLQRVDRKPATGHPHRYFDQSAIATAAFTDPRNISPTATGPTRNERTVFIKAITAQTNFGLFDTDVTRQQGQFAYVEAKDVEDITSACVITSASAVWNGNDTSLTTPTTTQYVGLLTQITNQFTITVGTSITNALKSNVAAMMKNPLQKVRPSAIYLSPILNDLIDRESRAAKIELGTLEITAGVTVKYLATQAGNLPLISDPFIPIDGTGQFGFAAPGSGNSNYFAVILDEKQVEMPHITGETGTLDPRVFQLGLVGGLQGQFVAVWFNSVVAKMAGYAHAVVAVVRPTVAAI